MTRLKGIHNENVFSKAWDIFLLSWRHPVAYAKELFPFLQEIYDEYKELSLPVSNELEMYVNWRKKQIGIKTRKKERPLPPDFDIKLPCEDKDE